jgi:hypothetical protein
MTKRRIYGEDKPMMDWVRNHPNLPSYSMNHGRTVNDVDFLIHQYKTIVDGVGTREIQFMMHVETKSRGGIPDASQSDTLFKEHKMKCGTNRINGKQVRHHGVSVLSMSGINPADSVSLSWGRFQGDSREITFLTITESELISLLTFEKDPDTLLNIDLRRHHKTRSIIKVEKSPLGFDVPVARTKRS